MVDPETTANAGSGLLPSPQSMAAVYWLGPASAPCGTLNEPRVSGPVAKPWKTLMAGGAAKPPAARQLRPRCS